MKNGKLPTGVEARESSIRIAFSWKGQYCRETIRLPPTPRNIKYAANLREEILRRIAVGTFDYGEYFPDSPNAKPKETRANPTFGELAERWLKGQDHLAFSTLKEYRAILHRDFLPLLADTPIRDLTYSRLMEVVGGKEWASMKSRNNALTPLKRIFDMALIDGVIDVNPADRLRMAKVQKPVPDPLTLEEIDRVLAWMEREPQWRNYFEFAFFTGLRTSELVALQWGDIDFLGRTARVQRAKVRKQEKGTKTSTIRDVELHSRAVAALERQKQWTFLAGGRIFLHPATGREIVDDRPPRLFWTQALKAVGLRHRDAYQTRHTYISYALMAGANPSWVSKQAGHSSTQMTFNRYAKWINLADAGKELSKLEGVNLPETSPEKKKAL